MPAMHRPVAEQTLQLALELGNTSEQFENLGAVADVVEIWMTLSLAFSGYRVMRQRQAFADLS